LLRLMALHADQPIHRERLADSLWPDMNTDTAMHNLQVTISALRKTLQQQAPTIEIKRDGDAYRLDLGAGGHSDVREFERQLARAAKARAAGDDAAAARAFARALEHYTGDLLSEEGAEWVFEPRDRYRTLAAAAAASLAELELDRGDAAAAAVAAGRGVHIDRCHDGSWRALIRAHKLRGDLASAKQAQRGYRTMLDSLGVTDVA
jgi:DNA-binding SARP family transcriptional activator